MLQLLWNQLAYLGVLKLEDESEQKYVILLNSLALIISLFTLMIVGTFAIVTPAIHLRAFAQPIAYAILTPVSLWLNARGNHLAARTYFAGLTFLFLLHGSLNSGGPSGFHNFLLVGIMVQFFVFPRRNRRMMIFFVCIFTLYYVFYQGFLHDFPGWQKLEGQALAQARIINGIALGLMTLAFAAYASFTFLTAERYLHAEKEKSERLLLNILPAAIAEKLRERPDTIAERFENCTVLFSDIVGFTELSRRLSAVEVVRLLNDIFSAFDDLAEKHGLEKIKTIGDAYMVVGGLPDPDTRHAERVARFSLDMLEVVRQYRRDHDYPIELRVGVSSGDAVAGVIGKKKFVYDLWGDSVNTASRMESHGLPGRVQVTESTYQLIRDRFSFEERGAIDVKGLGSVRSYLLLAEC